MKEYQYKFQDGFCVMTCKLSFFKIRRYERIHGKLITKVKCGYLI